MKLVSNKNLCQVQTLKYVTSWPYPKTQNILALKYFPCWQYEQTIFSICQILQRHRTRFRCRSENKIAANPNRLDEFWYKSDFESKLGLGPEQNASLGGHHHRKLSCTRLHQPPVFLRTKKVLTPMTYHLL